MIQNQKQTYFAQPTRFKSMKSLEFSKVALTKLNNLWSREKLNSLFK